MTSRAYTNRRLEASQQPAVEAASDCGFVHISDAVAAFFSDLQAEAEKEVEQRGGFDGQVRSPQRRWSRTLDVIEHERQADRA